MKNMKTTQSDNLKTWKKKLTCFLRDPLFLSRWVDPLYFHRERNRLSVSSYNIDSRSRWYPYERDISMFVEDMHNGIMPFTHIHREDSQFAVRLDPPREGLEAVIAEALGGKRRQWDLPDALCDFIREASQSLFFYGKLVYEILCETDSKGAISKFSFISVPPLSVKRVFGVGIQVIPWWVAKHSHIKVGIYRIPKKKMLYLEFPQRLGGRKGLKKILKRLDVLSKQLIPEFQMEAMKEQRNIGFDINKYVRAKYLEKAQITRRLGWNQRKVPEKELLEYYSLYRRLNFALSQAIVREHILETVNQSLNGSLLNLGTRIVIDGIPSSKQIEAQFPVLKAGNLEFTALFKITSII